MFYDIFETLCAKKCVKPNTVTKAVGLSSATASNWKTSGRIPNGEALIKIADYLNCSVDYLLGRTSSPEETSVAVHSDESQKISSENMFNSVKQQKSAPPISDEAQKIAKRYDNLDIHGKGAVECIVAYEEHRMHAEQPKAPETPKTKIIPLFGTSFAAGPAEPDTGNLFEDYEVPTDSRAEFAIRINGDSMEPYLPDGSIALGRKETPADGDIAAILLDGEFLCKQVCEDNFGNLYLLSLNRDRADCDVFISNNSERSIRCFGKIIMKKRVPLPKA